MSPIGRSMTRRSSPPILLILRFLLLCKLAAGFDDRISINCGSTSSATSLGGREWMGDVYPRFSSSSVVVKGHSTRTTARRLQQIVDPVPYATARISRSRFSYDFRLIPGQKHIRLHFNPTAYKSGSGLFISLEDYFSVEADQFTLLKNFSASITARALGLNAFTKEFCVNVRENIPFSLVFTAETSPSSSRGFYAFVNGIEIVSAPSCLSYCHGDDIGVQVLGQKVMAYIDSSTALEMVCRLGVKKKASVFSDTGSYGTVMFRIGANIVDQRANKISDNSWKVAVDVGFRYLIRFHFSEMGLNLGGASSEDFMILVNDMIAVTNADMLRERVDKGVPWYKSYMMMVNGNKREGKRDIMISLHLKDGIKRGSASLEGFQVFKLSNHDNSLASPNQLPPVPDSLSQTVRNFLATLGPINAIATFAVTLVCLASVAIHKLQQSMEGSFTEEEIMPLARANTLCRRFSLTEIQLATDNFSDLLVIGKGGFGKVYKGRIDNGKQTVAVKRLKSSSKQGRHEFQTEIELLSELRHVNVISLIGYCNEDREMILVYEHVPGGSLADHLYKLARKNNTCTYLSWKQRLKICIGAGRGLDYLHTGHRIMHRDIKPSNILLDENFVAKVADFGLAKIQSGQSQASTNFKGTLGYMDPDYFRTHRLTMKSDTYSFGVVLLEVLCARPAVEPWAEEDKRSITMWARDKISKGQVDQIVDPNLKDEMSPTSVNAFVRIVERCLDDVPKKRPAIAHVIINLEFALEQQECVNSSAPNEIDGLANVLPLIETPVPRNVTTLINEIEQVPFLRQKENVQRSLGPNEFGNAADDMPNTSDAMQENGRSFLPTEITVEGTRPQTMTTLKYVTSPFKELFRSRRISAGTKDLVKNTMHRLSRFWRRSSRKPSNRKSSTGFISVATRNSKLKHTASTPAENRFGGELLLSPNLRVFPFKKLKAITENFSSGALLGAGGFGRVYKGLLKDGTGSTIAVAVKMLSSGSKQGLEELMAEVRFLGRLSHPNLVKLLGYCMEKGELLLVYEFMQRGSLGSNLFRRKGHNFLYILKVHIQASYTTNFVEHGFCFSVCILHIIEADNLLPWDIRLKILTGAARGLAFLHDRNVIHRDFKVENILLDESYEPKLSDFGLARWGPAADHSHVSTDIKGTLGYLAPEYFRTGHLTLASEVFSFGIVLVETMTGLRPNDYLRLSEEKDPIEWIRLQLLDRRKLLKVVDSRLEGRFPASSVVQTARLAYHCLESDPKKRPSSQEVLEALEKCQA